MVLRVRNQRQHSVQTEAQYIYLHYALLAYFRYLGMITDEQLNNFKATYNEYIQTLPNQHPSPYPL